jgi:hypothetical protein
VRLWREPTLHFLLLGVGLFLAHRLVVGDPRVIVVTRGLRADLERRWRDENGRRPTAEELAAALDRWKRDEALYREALREHLDRDDPTVRIVLADKLRNRAVEEMPKAEPTDQELDRFLAQHRDAYEIPLHYDFELVPFAKTEAAAEKLRSTYASALAGGAKPATLGRPILSGSLTRDDLAGRYGAAMAAALCALPVGSWQGLENQDGWWLARVNRVEGGLPSRDEIRPRLVSDWGKARRQEAIERMVRAVLGRYRIEERP